MHRIALFILLVISIAGCGNGTPAASTQRPVSEMTVYAAASLTDSFRALGAAFQASRPGVTIRFNFAGTPTLVTQIEQGAQVDVFASADMTNMDKVKADGFANGRPQVFAHNKLEIVVAAGNPKRIKGLADLAKPGVIYITEAPTVPAGKYSRQALARAGVSVTPKSLETDVKSVVSKIELGEADAGIVYTTDIKAAGNKVLGVPIPDSDNVVATYPLVEIKGAPNPTAAMAFIDFVRSPSGQSKLDSYGFLPA